MFYEPYIYAISGRIADDTVFQRLQHIQILDMNYENWYTRVLKYGEFNELQWEKQK